MNKLIFKLCLIAIFFFFLVSICIGFYKSELSGYLFWAIISLSVFTDILIIISFFCTKKEFSISRNMWILLSVLTLALSFIFISSSDHNANSEIGVLIDYPMSILSMPFGIAANLILSGMFEMRPDGFYFGNIYDWTLFFVFGYLQWFLIFPRVFKK